MTSDDDDELCWICGLPGLMTGHKRYACDSCDVQWLAAGYWAETDYKSYEGWRRHADAADRATEKRIGLMFVDFAAEWSPCP